MGSFKRIGLHALHRGKDSIGSFLATKIGNSLHFIHHIAKNKFARKYIDILHYQKRYISNLTCLMFVDVNVFFYKLDTNQRNLFRIN
jgi:hypothetical protein